MASIRNTSIAFGITAVAMGGLLTLSGAITGANSPDAAAHFNAACKTPVPEDHVGVQFVSALNAKMIACAFWPGAEIGYTLSKK